MNPAIIKWLSGLGSLLTFTFYLAYTHPIPQTNAETDAINDAGDEESISVTPAEARLPVSTTQEPAFEFSANQEETLVTKKSFTEQNQKPAPKKTTKPKVVKKSKPTNANREVAPSKTLVAETPQPDLEIILPEPTMEPTPEIQPEPTVDWSQEQPAPRKRLRSRAS